MANPAVSLIGGAGAGVSTTYFNYNMCKDAGLFKQFSEQCSGAFGPLSHWAATNPETAAVILGVVGFGLVQGAQMIIGKAFE
jgi:hypothetical protein